MATVGKTQCSLPTKPWLVWFNGSTSCFKLLFSCWNNPYLRSCSTCNSVKPSSHGAYKSTILKEFKHITMYNKFNQSFGPWKHYSYISDGKRNAHSRPSGFLSTSVNFHCKCWKGVWYIFIFLDGCALFPQYCRWTKTTASRQVNIELPESAVCSRQGLQQFITERQYKARPVWLELVNYNKSLGVFFPLFLVTRDGGSWHSTNVQRTVLRAFCLSQTEI